MMLYDVTAYLYSPHVTAYLYSFVHAAMLHLQVRTSSFVTVDAPAAIPSPVADGRPPRDCALQRT